MSIQKKYEYNVYIAHASEDKDAYVNQLAEELEKHNLKVWYDDFILLVGDNLLETINKGLSSSEYGIVVISPNFTKKEWPKRELDALFSQEFNGVNKILPIWLNMSYEEVVAYFPLIASKYALKANDGIDKNVYGIMKRVKPDALRNETVKKVIEKYDNLEKEEVSVVILEVLLRFERIVKKMSYVTRKQSEEGIESYYDKWYDSTNKRFELPNELYDFGDPVENITINQVKPLLKKWVRGVLEDESIHELFFILDELQDLDTWYILYGVPNQILRQGDYDLFFDHMIDWGKRNLKNKKPKHN
jgi:hypothetical protein